MATKKVRVFSSTALRWLTLLILVVLSVLGSIRYVYLSPPFGIHRQVPLDLHQIQGPWFEVARLESPLEQDLKYPVLFIKYTGPGADGLYPYSDPSDPRFRVVLMGQSESGTRRIALDTTTYMLDDYRTSTLVMTCPNGLPCAYHLIDYDLENQSWMVVTGRNKSQLWIFSRSPGIFPDTLKMIKKKLSAQGYDVDALIYGNTLPKLPDVLPKIPETLPIPPSNKP